MSKIRVTFYNQGEQKLDPVEVPFTEVDNKPRLNDQELREVNRSLRTKYSEADLRRINRAEVFLGDKKQYGPNFFADYPGKDFKNAIGVKEEAKPSPAPFRYPAKEFDPKKHCMGPNPAHPGMVTSLDYLMVNFANKTEANQFDAFEKVIEDFGFRIGGSAPVARQVVIELIREELSTKCPTDQGIHLLNELYKELNNQKSKYGITAVAFDAHVGPVSK